MTREELEKMFDERFNGLHSYLQNADSDLSDIKDFIFETIIPEVYRNMVEDYGYFNDGCGCCETCRLGTVLKEDAKKWYNIDL